MSDSMYFLLYISAVFFVGIMVSQSVQTKTILHSQEIMYSNLVIRLEQVEKP